MDTIRVLLAGDETLVRAGLRLLLENLPDTEVVAEATDGQETIRLVEQHAPDVVLISTVRPDLKDLEVTRLLTNTFPTLRVIILSTYSDEDRVDATQQAGAAGYLLTSADKRELQLAIRAVAQGKTYLSPSISKERTTIHSSGKAAAASSLRGLTTRQTQVLKLIAEGKTNKQMATELKISPKTVDSHRMELMDRLEIHDLARLVRFAIKSGLVNPED